jgi:hypothetical protein
MDIWCKEWRRFIKDKRLDYKNYLSQWRYCDRSY